MEFQTIEEMTDVVSLSVERAADIQTIALTKRDSFELGEAAATSAVTFTQKGVSNSWDEEYQPRITVEEYLTINSSDSAGVQAAKQCVNEILARQNCSRPVVALYRNSGGQTTHDCAPTNVDFKIDVCLAAKHVLPLALYQVLCAMLNESFERWHLVPVSLQKRILEKTGAELLQRKIFSVKRGTRGYWDNNFKKYGRKSAPASFRLT